MKKYLKLILTLTLFVGMPIAAYAGSTIRIDKPKVRLNIAPGSSAAGSIRVENISDYAVKVKVYLEDWQYIPPYDGAKDFKSAGTLPRSASGLISYAPSELTIQPFSYENVNYTAKMPADAAGGYYSIMFFETQIAQQKNEVGVTVDVLGRIGALFYLIPEGKQDNNFEFRNFTVSSPANNLQVSFDLANNGRTDVITEANYYIIDKSGIVYARGDFNALYLLPGDTGKAQSIWKEALAPGEYDLVLTVDLGKALEELNMGRGPVSVKESHLVVGPDSRIVSISELR